MGIRPTGSDWALLKAMTGGVPGSRLIIWVSDGRFLEDGPGLGAGVGNNGSESAGPAAPGEGLARVQVGPGAAPKRLDGGGRDWKTGNVGIGPTGPVEDDDRRSPGGSPNNTGQRWQNSGTSEVGPGLGAGNGDRRVRECRAVCSR